MDDGCDFVELVILKINNENKNFPGCLLLNGHNKKKGIPSSSTIIIIFYKIRWMSDADVETQRDTKKNYRK